MGGLILGYNLTLFDNLGNAVCDAFNLKDGHDRATLKSWINTFYPMGKMIGSFLGSLMSESFGRKNTLIFAEILAFFSYLSGFPVNTFI